MNQPSKPRRPGPPHNPGVRDLVEGKRRWSSPPKPEDAKRGFRAWNERGYLPHRDEPGLTQFVTFRLADSFPQELRSEWEQLLKIEDDQQRRAEFNRSCEAGEPADLPPVQRKVIVCAVLRRGYERHLFLQRTRAGDLCLFIPRALA